MSFKEKGNGRATQRRQRKAASSTAQQGRVRPKWVPSPPSSFSGGSPPLWRRFTLHSLVLLVRHLLPFGRVFATSSLPGRELTPPFGGSSSPLLWWSLPLRLWRRPSPMVHSHPIGGGFSSLPVWWRSAYRISFSGGSPPSLSRWTRFDPSLPSFGGGSPSSHFGDRCFSFSFLAFFVFDSAFMVTPLRHRLDCFVFSA